MKRVTRRMRLPKGLRLNMRVEVFFRGRFRGLGSVFGQVVARMVAGIRRVGIMLEGEEAFRPLSDFKELRPVTA